MATLRWVGSAPRIAQVTDYLFAGTWEATDIVTLTIGQVTLSVTAGSTTISTIIDTIVTAFNALDPDDYPEFATITASRTSNTLRLTADDAGIPFTCTVATTETGGGAADAQTIDGATSSSGTDSTACSSPNHWSIASNWSTGAVPVDNDTVIIDGDKPSILYGISQSSIDLTALTVYQNFTGTIGLPERNEDGYHEYRTTYLTLGTVTTLKIGVGEGSGSGRIKINVGSNACTCNVLNTGSPEEQGIPAFLFKGGSASNVLNVTKGSVGAGFLPAETVNLSGGVRIGYRDNQQGDSQVWIGDGATVATINKDGGFLELNSAATTINHEAGEMRFEGSGALGTLNIAGGDVRYNSSGTLTTATVAGDGHLDFSQDMRAKTVTNPVEMYGEQSRFTDDFEVVASLVLDLNQRKSLEGIRIGRNVRLTRGTPA